MRYTRLRFAMILALGPTAACSGRELVVWSGVPHRGPVESECSLLWEGPHAMLRVVATSPDCDTGPGVDLLVMTTNSAGKSRIDTNLPTVQLLRSPPPDCNEPRPGCLTSKLFSAPPDTVVDYVVSAHCGDELISGRGQCVVR